MTITPASMRKVIAKTVLKSEEIDPWSTLIEDAASKEEILQVLLMDFFEKIYLYSKRN